jgi:hypothetical protein
LPFFLQQLLRQRLLQHIVPVPWLRGVSAGALQRLFLWAWDCVSSRSMFFNGPMGKVLLLFYHCFNSTHVDIRDLRSLFGALDNMICFAATLRFFQI